MAEVDGELRTAAGGDGGSVSSLHGAAARTFSRIRQLTGAAIGDYHMIRDGDRIVVGLSGNADSMVLMHVLHELRRRAPVSFEIVAVTVDMGFATFQSELVADYCRERRWRHEVVSVPGLELMREKGAEKRPCAFCSRLRRGMLHAAADRLGCGKIALGHQLDDLCVSLLLSVFRGGGLTTMGPHVPADSGSKRLIRPLCYVPKSLIRTAAAALALPAVRSCPYDTMLKVDGDRAYLETMIDRFEERFPALRQNILASLKNVQHTHLLDPAFVDAEARGG